MQYLQQESRKVLKAVTLKPRGFITHVTAPCGLVLSRRHLQTTFSLRFFFSIRRLEHQDVCHCFAEIWEVVRRARTRGVGDLPPSAQAERRRWQERRRETAARRRAAAAESPSAAGSAGLRHAQTRPHRRLLARPR